MIVQYATAKIGAILVNINPAYRTHELAYVVRQSGLRLLVSAEGFKTSDYRAMVGEVAGECPGLERTDLPRHVRLGGFAGRGCGRVRRRSAGAHGQPVRG